METTTSERGQPHYARTNTRHDDILVDFNGAIDEHDFNGNTQYGQGLEQDAQSVNRRQTTKRSSRSYSSRMSRQKSRRRVLGKSGKMGITLDTSVTRHKGTQPHQVYPGDDLHSGGSVKKNWFSGGRASFKNKGLGITKGTPQPDIEHRTNRSIDQGEMLTAISLTPGSKTWQDISPWDRRIPIGISVPTDSVSDFSSYQGMRQRSGSEATLVTPNIVITPAEAMKSVWSPDTPFSGESDYTSSIPSRAPFGSRYHDSAVPPVPAIPAGVSSSAGIEVTSKSASNHTRNDTLDSAGTAFEEDEDVKRNQRIMSTGTVFEEDETPLRERHLDAPIVVDSSLLPTPRRSQGWWNVITTPFVTTPNTAVFPQSGRSGEQAPVIPPMPALTGPGSDSQMVPTKTVSIPRTTEPVQPPATVSPDRNIASPTSAMSASPVVRTAAIGTVLMPLQIEEPRRAINVNIELQDRRPPVVAQTTIVGAPPAVQQTQPTAVPISQFSNTTIIASRTNSPGQALPVFAPPPSHPVKGSHFSYDAASRSSSPNSIPDLKNKKPKKHRKVADIMSCLPFGKRKQKESQEKKKKKKRGVCFWGCCCCLLFLVILAIIIPLTVVLTRKRNDEPPTTTKPDQGGSSGWLNLPNYPPIPTGVSTVSQPEAVVEQSGCVAPTTLWSCALPKELQESVKPNKPDQPNFRIQITYQDNKTKRAANPVSAGAFVRSQLLKLRAVTSPVPAPPSTSDMSFLGKTTDGNAAPFEGETTPLSLTFLDIKKTTTSRMIKRAANDDPTNITMVIPPPALDADGTAAAANLLPLPVAQPLRLFNRGKDNEYYGFYTYFDRSIFLKQINGTNRGGNPADIDGGSPKSAANLRCTFSQTRFLVQIWTRSQSTKKLLQGTAQNANDASKRPGTFPYPVTFTLDRHGGDPTKKNLFCYELESDGTIKNVDSKKSFQFEDRAFGGVLVNGTQGRPVSSGPIDGGTGGCRCQWQNFLE